MAPRTRYLVSYDITDDVVRNRVFVVLQGFGTWMQYSVFLCDLDQREMIALRSRLHVEIDHKVDSVMVVDIGIASDRGRYCFEFIGRGLQLPSPGGPQVL